MAQGLIAQQATAMADTVILSAEVPPAVAAFTNCFHYGLFLLSTGSDCFYGRVVAAVDALTDARGAGYALLQADAVELTALTALAIAAL